MTTIRVILWKLTRRSVIDKPPRYIAEVLYVDNADTSMMYISEGYLLPALTSFDSTPDILIEQVSDQEAIELLEKLRRHYNVLVVRAKLDNPPDNVIVSHTDLLDRI